MTELRRWQDVPLDEAVSINLAERDDITAPLTSWGERCPWPWDPQQLVGAPIGQYHCGYCGEMVLAGVEHLDYAGMDESYAAFVENEMDAQDYRDMPERESWSG